MTLNQLFLYMHIICTGVFSESYINEIAEVIQRSKLSWQQKLDLFAVRQNRDLFLPAETLGYFQVSSNSGWHEMRICLETVSSCTSCLCPLLK